jgi:predicted nucleic acid-binding protein
MPDLFVDTAGWGSLADRKQPFHSLATGFYRAARRQGRKIVTTNYVLVELVALLSSPIRMPRLAAITVVEDVRASPYVEVIHVDPTLDMEAWQFLRNRPDKEWSLVDCVSFVVMSKRGILEALTTDHHFEQAGFVRLLK